MIASNSPESNHGSVLSHSLILLILIFVQFTSIVDFMVIMPLEPQLSREMNLDAQHFGFIVSAYTFAAGIVAFLASPMLDHFSRRSAFLFLYVGFLVGTFACAAAPNYYSLLAARFLTGAFGGLLGGVSMAIIGDVFPEHRRGRATGALMMSFSMASILGVPIGLYLGQRYGWHLPFYLIVVLGIPIVILAVMVMPRLDDHMNNRSTASYLLRQLHMMRDVNNLRAFALTVAMQFGTFAVVTFLAAYMVSNVGVPEHQLHYAYMAGGLLALVGSPVVGYISDRIGKPPVYRIMATASAIVMLVVTTLPPVPVIAAVFIMGSLMLTNAGRMVPAMAMLTSSIPPERRGSFLTINSAVQHLSSGLGASIAGLILSKGADGHLIGFGWVGLLGAVTTIASIFIANRLKIYVPAPPSTIEETIAAAATTVDSGTEIPVAATDEL